MIENDPDLLNRSGRDLSEFDQRPSISGIIPIARKLAYKVSVACLSEYDIGVRQGAIRRLGAPVTPGNHKNLSSCASIRSFGFFRAIAQTRHEMPFRFLQLTRGAVTLHQTLELGDPSMEVRAAVAVGAGKPLEVTTVNLEGPRAFEVLVEVKATGICHTDEFTLSGADPEGLFPAILGHEGAGVVVEVGPGVTTLKPGDHVIPLYTPECRNCEYCLNPKTNLCQAIRSTQGQGLMPDGSSRFTTLDGDPILHYMGTSTFANYTVVPEIALAKIRPDAPFDKVCYIGCGVTTGIGAVINTAKVEEGSRAIVFGLGGIGLNVIQGLRLAGADQIVGVDLNPAKVEMATRFGMTDFVNPSDVEGELVPYLVDLTKGGADYTFDATGNVNVMRTALESAHKGWGESIIIGVAPAGAEIATRPFQLVTGRVWKGTAFGGARGRTDVPKIVDWYMDGKIEIDPMITHTMPLEDINKGFDLMHAGESIRSVVVY